MTAWNRGRHSADIASFFLWKAIRVQHHQHTRHYKMIQRSLLQQSRAISSHLRTRPIPLPSRFYSPPTRISPLAASRALTSRWYSSETQPEPTTGESASITEQAVPEAETVPPTEDPLKKEVETKNREIIDLKVLLASPNLHSLPNLFSSHRTNTSAPSPTSATCKTARSATSLRRGISPSRASLRTSSTAWTTWTVRWAPCRRKS